MKTTHRQNTPDGALAAAFALSPGYAAASEGGYASNAAALLVVLGIWALAMGVRNLRAMRYKPLVPQRRQPADTPPDDRDE